MNIVKNIYTKAIQVITTVLYLFVVGFVMASLVSFIYSALTNQELTLMGYKPIYIISGSMQDGNKDTEIQKDSIIISKKITERNIGELKPGDVITFTLNGVEDLGNVDVTHRLVKVNKKEKTFISMGDANDVVDTFITDESAEGFLSTSRIKYKMILRNNWLSKVINTFRYKPVVFGLYTLSALIGFGIIYYINELLYETELEINFLKENDTK